MILALLAPFPAAPEPARAESPDGRLSPPRPEAPPLGLRFHSSIPAEVRKVLVDDLLWLVTVPPLTGSGPLGRVLGFGDTLVDGPMLASWILARARFIASVEYCPFTAAVILDDRRPATLRFSGLNASCGTSAQAMALVYADPRWRRAKEGARETDGLYLDDHVVVHPRRAGLGLPGIFVQLSALATNFTLGPADTTTPVPARLARLLGLVHEARHFDGYSHGSCGRANLAATPLKLAAMSLRRFGPDARYCDDSTWGPQGLPGEIVRLFVADCRGCSPQEVFDLHRLASIHWSRVVVATRRPIALKDFASPASLRELPPEVASLTIESAPHREFFAANRGVNVALVGRQCPAENRGARCEDLRTNLVQIDALIATLEAAERAGEFAAPWSGRTAQVPEAARPDPAAARAWLAALGAAAGQGYNVPASWALHCSQLAVGCLAGLGTRDVATARIGRDAEEPPIVIEGEEMPWHPSLAGPANAPGPPAASSP